MTAYARIRRETADTYITEAQYRTPRQSEALAEFMVNLQGRAHPDLPVDVVAEAVEEGERDAIRLFRLWLKNDSMPALRCGWKARN